MSLSVERAAYLQKCGRMDVTLHLSGMEIKKGRDVRGMKYGSVTLLFDSVEAKDGFWVKTQTAAFGPLADLVRMSLILPSQDKNSIQVLTAIRGKYAYDPDANNAADLGDVHPAFKEAAVKEAEGFAELVRELDGSSALDRIYGLLKGYFNMAEPSRSPPGAESA